MVRKRSCEEDEEVGKWRVEADVQPWKGVGAGHDSGRRRRNMGGSMRSNVSARSVSAEGDTDEVRRRRDHLVAAAGDCCCQWWISSTSADRPKLSESRVILPASDVRREETPDRFKTCDIPQAYFPSHRSILLLAVDLGEESALLDSDLDEGSTPADDALPSTAAAASVPPAAPSKQQTTFYQHTIAGPLQVALDGVSRPHFLVENLSALEVERRKCASCEAGCGEAVWGKVGNTWGTRSCRTSSSKWGQSAMFLLALVHFVLWQPTGSWIALSKDGYTVKHNVIAGGWSIYT